MNYRGNLFEFMCIFGHCNLHRNKGKLWNELLRYKTLRTY